MDLSVILPSCNPDPARLHQTLKALTNQSLKETSWELLLIDNASTIPLRHPSLPAPAASFRIIREPLPGLSQARLRGFQEAKGTVLILVDDDNVLAPDYLEKSLDLMRQNPAWGLAGGKSLPVFEQAPEKSLRVFDGLLALRDLGDATIVASWEGEYPECSPIGAGMVLRREAAAAWLSSGHPSLSDRKGNSLSSGGDNDIVLCALKAGWQVAYDPGLLLEHLIPASRVHVDYLARLNRGIQKSWMQVLTLHGINPWPAIESWSLALRMAKAWLYQKAWSSSASYIHWQGSCGHFEGRVKNNLKRHCNR